MGYNLFIAYDLHAPSQDYRAVREAIEDLGQHYQFQLSLYYVHTPYTPEEAFAIISRHIDLDDRLAVINAERGIVTNWDHPPIDAINAIWHQP